jgi:hypothetical protein
MRHLLSVCAAFLFLVLAIGSGQPVPQPSVELGERAVFSDAEWVVTEAVDLGDAIDTNDGSATLTTTGRFVKVTFTLTNRSPEAWMPIVVPDLQDATGRSHSALDITLHLFYVPEGTPKYRWRDLPPGETRTYTLIYDIEDPTAEGLRLGVGTLNEVEASDFRYVDLGL